MDPPASAVGDRGELLDIDMDQLAGPVPLVALHRDRGDGTVADIEATQAGLTQDALHRRRCDPDLMSDVISTPAVLTTKSDDFPAAGFGSPVRGPQRPTGTVPKPR